MQAITITLNGVEVSGHPGTTILDLAHEAGVRIPTLCHSPHLKPYGACRICLVEDERNGALLASCVAPIAPGMIINTESEKVIESRRTIIKLMLASHPDTCMVCDKGNRCQLRSIAADLGVGWIDLQRIPLPAQIQELNPFIERDLSKCILCAKCIRADHERVAIGAIDYFNRGFGSKPATLGDLPLENSECTFCGTCVAVCPTGAISERIRTSSGSTPVVVSSVCSFCGCGCNIDLEVIGNRVIRVRPHEENSPNDITLCARGAYGYDYIHSPERLMQPLIKIDGEFQPASWEDALHLTSDKLSELKAKHGPRKLAVLGSSKCTNEENYLLQKLGREVLETPNIDNGGSLYNAAARMAPMQARSIEEIERSDLILLIGDDIAISAPLVSYAVKRAMKFGNASLLQIDSFSREQTQAVAESITKAQKTSIIYSPSKNDMQTATALADLGKAENVSLYTLQKENNALGSADMGCLPDMLPGYQPVTSDAGMNISEILQETESGKLKGMLIMGENPSKVNFSPLEFLVVLDIFLTETAQQADVVLPAASFAEKEGTFTNFEGRVQRIRKAIDPPGEARPDWEIILSLAKEMGQPMDYTSPQAIMDQIALEISLYSEISYEKLDSRGGMLRQPVTQEIPQKSIPETAFAQHDSIYRFGSEARSSRSKRLSQMVAQKCPVEV